MLCSNYQRMIEEYHFSGKTPLRETVFAALEKKPKLLERKKIFVRIVKQMLEIVATFDDGMGGVDKCAVSASLRLTKIVIKLPSAP